MCFMPESRDTMNNTDLSVFMIKWDHDNIGNYNPVE